MVELHKKSCESMDEIRDHSVDIVITSPPYKDEDGYSPGLMRSLASELYRVMKPGTLAFVNFGQLASDKGRPFECANELAKKLDWIDTIIWVKSNPFSGGHYTPINSDYRMNNMFEYIFQFSKGKAKIDRLSLGIPYMHKCLSSYTEIIAKKDGVICLSTLGSIKNSFDNGSKIEVPSYDFNEQKTVWTKVLSFSESYQTLKRITLRNGSTVDTSLDHRFPINKYNTRNKENVLNCNTVSEIIDRQNKWKTKPVSFYVHQDFSNLLHDSKSPIYTYDTGYFLGLYLAEGYAHGEIGIDFAAHLNEADKPSFGGFLNKYCDEYLGCNVNIYPNSSENGIIFNISNKVAKSIADTFISGNSAINKRLNIEKILQFGKQFARGIIDGFCEGDGSFVSEYNYYTFGICDNKILVNQLRSLCLMVGYEFKENKSSMVKAFGKEYKQLRFWIRKCCYYGKRKPLENGLSVERLNSIDNPYGKANLGTKTIDLEVEIDHHMFFLANGMLTHNSNIKRYGVFDEDQQKQDVRCAGNVWYVGYPTVQSKKQKPHKDMFPEEIPTRCLKLANLPERSLVLDPFMGSGTTARAARKMGMNAVGYEINKKFWNSIFDDED